MFKNLFNSIFTSASETVAVTDFLLCIAVSIIAGIIFAAVYAFKSRYTKSFLLTLALLPAAVCVVIMAVNGNVGAGVAVAGAFSLVRFRSVPGTARDIVSIFLAMGAGLMAGMGYLAYSLLYTVIMCLAMLIFTVFASRKKTPSVYRSLRITIPEDLDYTHIFDDLMQKYTREYEVTAVKTVNMGSLFRITYNVTLRNADDEKKFIDELRCRNGNLEISMSRQEANANEL